MNLLPAIVFAYSLRAAAISLTLRWLSRVAFWFVTTAIESEAKGKRVFTPWRFSPSMKPRSRSSVVQGGDAASNRAMISLQMASKRSGRVMRTKSSPPMCPTKSFGSPSFCRPPR